MKVNTKVYYVVWSDSVRILYETVSLTMANKYKTHNIVNGNAI